MTSNFIFKHSLNRRFQKYYQNCVLRLKKRINQFFYVDVPLNHMSHSPCLLKFYFEIKPIALTIVKYLRVYQRSFNMLIMVAYPLKKEDMLKVSAIHI